MAVSSSLQLSPWAVKTMLLLSVFSRTQPRIDTTETQATHALRTTRAQVDASLVDINPLNDIEAVVCHTEMEEMGSFFCSQKAFTQVLDNTKWSMKGNFLSIPTDCPQRDERLGWTGDLAVFASTATIFYDCSSMLRDWLDDLASGQGLQGGVPPMVCPNVVPHLNEEGKA
ncbi:hypothetical protein ACHAPT_001397 [Fusarium lateritium]